MADIAASVLARMNNNSVQSDRSHQLWLQQPMKERKVQTKSKIVEFIEMTIE